MQGGLALGLALLINQKLRGINVYRAIYFMPVVVSIVVVSIGLFIYLSAPRGSLLWLMAGAVALWFAAGYWRLSLPNYPSEGGWFFNPLAWQVIFITGLLTGVAMKDGRRFVPVRLWLQVLTGGFVLFAAVATQVPAVSKAMGNALWVTGETLHLPWFVTAFDKSFVTGPRLLHILALAYFVSTFPAVRRICATAFAKPFELLGRQALPVFALGSVLCIGFQGVKHALGDSVALDAGLLAVGLAAQFALAAVRQYWPKARA